MKKIAILYDFDKTLSTTDMQEYDFIKNLGISNSEFWGQTSRLTIDNDADKILAYMYMMVKFCKEKNIKLTHEYLNECGKSVVLLPGVEDWFIRINQFAFSLGYEIEHYIISSGIVEIVEGTKIFKYFKKVFGCSFIYENEVAVWPKTSVNYTQKTQYLFRIAKGSLDITDDDTVNKKVSKFKIDYKNMIYIGDGITDVPCMKLIKEKGGNSIAVYRNKKDIVKTLVNDDRVNIVCEADYREGSMLFDAIKLIIGNIASYDKLKEKEEKAIKLMIGE